MLACSRGRPRGVDRIEPLVAHVATAHLTPDSPRGQSPPTADRALERWLRRIMSSPLLRARLVLSRPVDPVDLQPPLRFASGCCARVLARDFPAVRSRPHRGTARLCSAAYFPKGTSAI